MTQPLVYRWQEGAMVPVGRFARQAHTQFEPGQTYFLGEIEERSEASHKHEFAWLRDAWTNLPESVADQYPSAEHLRKRALIDAGFYNEQIIDAGSNAAALRVAAAIRSREQFSLVIVRGGFVVVRDPKSQSRRAMKRDEFQASKTGIMEVIADLIGVTPQQLSQRSKEGEPVAVSAA